MKSEEKEKEGCLQKKISAETEDNCYGVYCLCRHGRFNLSRTVVPDENLQNTLRTLVIHVVLCTVRSVPYIIGSFDSFTFQLFLNSIDRAFDKTKRIYRSLSNTQPDSALEGMLPKF